MASTSEKLLVKYVGLHYTRGETSGKDREVDDDGDDEGGFSSSSSDFVFNLDKNVLIDDVGLVTYDDRVLAKGPEPVEYIVYQGLFKGRSVAVKVIQPDRRGVVTRVRKERFEREVRVLSKLQDPNIVDFLGASVDPSMLIITEHMRGGTLQKYLSDIRPAVPDLRLAVSFALDICRAMKHLHENGIIHCDLTPFNLLLSEDKRNLKLGDFGLAREIEGTMSNEAGTYRWMAPDCYHKDASPRDEKKDYDHKADVYRFSIILWELLTNKIPFAARKIDILAAFDAAHNVRPSLDGINEELIPVLKACWAENPEDRPEFIDVRNHLLMFYQSHYLHEITPSSITGTTSGNEDGISEEVNVPGSPREELDVTKEKKKKKKKKRRRRKWLPRGSCFSTKEKPEQLM